MLERTQAALSMAKTEEVDGTYGASNWVAHNQRLEIDLITMLAVDCDTAHEDGDLVPVWPSADRKRDPNGS